MRKMSVTQLVDKLDYETPKSQDKLLPTLSPEERAQIEGLTQHIHELSREAYPRRTFQGAAQPPEDRSAHLQTSSNTEERSALLDGPSTEAGMLRFTPIFLSAGPATFPTSSMKSEEWMPSTSSRINAQEGCGAPERMIPLFEVQRKMSEQISELRKRRMEEQITRGEPVEVAPKMMSYNIDRDGNLTNLRDGPRERVIVGGRGTDGSYRVLYETVPDSGLFLSSEDIQSHAI